MSKPKEASPEPLSLVGPHETGGLYAWSGFDRQRRYIAMRAPEWAMQPGFVAMSPETFEDVDVRFSRDGKEVVCHVQVKMEQITPAKLKEWLEQFTTKNADRIARGVVERYVLAGPNISEDVRKAFALLEHFRNTSVAPGDAPVLDATRSEVVQRFGKLGLGEQAETIIKLVHLDTHFDGTESEDAAMRAVGSNLALHPSLLTDTQAASHAVAKELLRAIGDKKRFKWTGAELDKLVRKALQEHRAGPPRPAGDVVLVRHGTVRRVTADLSDPLLLKTWKERRRREIDVSALFESGGGAADNIRRALVQLTDPSGDFRSRLRDEPPVELAYFGFPHVPFGVAAGFIIGPQRHVHVVEHDRDTGAFAWPSNSDDVELAASTCATGRGAVARLRISISATVAPAVCPDLGELVLDIHVSAFEPRFDLIRSDASARKVAREIRRVLAKVSGNANVASLQVFAAVPVSVAVLLGQALAARALPATAVYNFAGADHYDWFLNLQSLDAPDGAFGLLNDSSNSRRS